MRSKNEIFALIISGAVKLNAKERLKEDIVAGSYVDVPNSY
jgi:hypothetical protein